MEKLGITVFDVAVIVVAFFGALMGMSSGFAHALMFIASWIGAGYLALNYSGLIQPEIAKLVNGNNELASFGSMLIVFVAALIVLVMLANALSRAVKTSPLRRPDAILGAGFGVLCAWVALGAAFLFYSYLGPKTLPPVVEAGATFPAIKDMATFVEPYLPPGFRTRLQHSGSGDALPSIPTPSLPSGTADPSLPANPASPATRP
jgi:membrane protein required for colicin V production